MRNKILDKFTIDFINNHFEELDLEKLDWKINEIKFKIMDKIFIHNDVENLRFFSNKHGISASSDRITHYAMQGGDIIRVFYNQKDAVDYYNKNRYSENLPIIYFFDQEKWNRKKL